jgi:hypothetical protein
MLSPIILVENQTSEILVSNWDNYAPILVNQLRLFAKDVHKIKDMKCVEPENQNFISFDREMDVVEIGFYVSKAGRGPQKVLFYYSIGKKSLVDI